MSLAEHLRVVDGIVLQAIHRRMQAAEKRVAQLEEQFQKMIVIEPLGLAGDES